MTEKKVGQRMRETSALAVGMMAIMNDDMLAGIGVAAENDPLSVIDSRLTAA